jgi:tRNA threonylcarbamoyladenosine biosynthesis protein TsaE
MTAGNYQSWLAGVQQTKDLGIILGQNLLPGAILLLQGGLGAGKTSLVQGIAAGLGIGEMVVSPTFTLINEYEEGRLPLYHLDLYRLCPQEVASLALPQYWQGQEYPEGVVAIEWPDRLLELPPYHWEIELVEWQGGRNITIKELGVGSNSLGALLPHLPAQIRSDRLR